MIETHSFVRVLNKTVLLGIVLLMQRRGSAGQGEEQWMDAAVDGLRVLANVFFLLIVWNKIN